MRLNVIALFLLWVFTVGMVSAQTFTTLYDFAGTNGSGPYFMKLVQGVDGNLYGTTSEGGANAAGTVFKIDSTGALTTLYSFCSQPNCADGYVPQAGLTLGSDGQFYGTTNFGGTNVNATCPSGCGTVFKITPSGKLSTLYSFCDLANCADGTFPNGALIQASNGVFYGVTFGGDPSNVCFNLSCGTIFKISAKGILATIYTMSPQDGGRPAAGLVEATDGNLYGTAVYGGDLSCGGQGVGCGTVFRISKLGKFTTIHNFEGTDGKSPLASLVQGGDGKLYGAAYEGGNFGCISGGCGTVFKMTLQGSIKTLHRFDGTDGELPAVGLIQATDGNFYGAALYGGLGGGTIYEITPSGAFTLIYNFTYDGTDGSFPEGTITQATDGSFYGTTNGGGNNACDLGCGTVFRFTNDLGPFVAFVRSVGKVGQTGALLGQGFTGTTSVSLNGTPATFTVVSDTFIKATVPAGATTGYVTVTTPSGALTSNVPFYVLP